eukprot:403357489
MDAASDFTSTNQDIIIGGYTTDSTVTSQVNAVNYYQAIILKQSLDGTISWQIPLLLDNSKVSLIKSSYDYSQYIAVVDQNNQITLVLGSTHFGLPERKLYQVINSTESVTISDVALTEATLVMIVTYPFDNKQVIFLFDSLNTFIVLSAIVQDYSSLRYMSFFVDSANQVIFIGGSSRRSSNDNKYAAIRIFGFEYALDSKLEVAFDQYGSSSHKFYTKYIYAESNTGFTCTALHSDFSDQSVTIRHLYRFDYNIIGTATIDSQRSFQYSNTDIGECHGLKMGLTSQIVFMLTYNSQTLKISLVKVNFMSGTATSGIYVYSLQTTFGNSIQLMSSIIISSSAVIFVGSLNQLSYQSQIKTFSESSFAKGYIMSMSTDQTCFDVTTSTAASTFTIQNPNLLTLSDSMYQVVCNAIANTVQISRLLISNSDCTYFSTESYLISLIPTTALDNFKLWCTYIESSSISTQTYIIGSSVMKIPITSFEQSCSSTSLIYTASLIYDGDETLTYSLPDGVTFTSSAVLGQYFNVYSINATIAGTYKLKVQGYDSTLSQSEYFTFNLDMSEEKIIPYFKSEIKDQTVHVNTPLFYKLPDTVNENGNTNKITVDLGLSKYFVSYQASQTQINFNPSSNSQAGEYYIAITITDSQLQTLKNYYTLKITVIRDPTVIENPQQSQNTTNQTNQNSTNNPNQTSNESSDYIPPFEQQSINLTTIEELNFSQEELQQYFEYIENLPESEYDSGIFSDSYMPGSNLSYNSAKYKRLINKYAYDRDINPQIQKIERNGVVTINFGTQMVIPKSYLNFTDSVILVTINGVKQKLKQTQNSSKKRYLFSTSSSTSNQDYGSSSSYSWYVSEFTQSYMKIQLNFDSPGQVSQDVSALKPFNI